MTTISYAQNYEDVMLLRALSEVDRGFYVDVGAQDPDGDSVTKLFYGRGWHGINIEPVTHWFERLVAQRPHDINLQVAVSDQPGSLHLYEAPDSGFSTTDVELARRYAGEDRSIRESDVECVTLDAILEAQGVETIHFLKIDCKGTESAVLKGLSLDRWRPWVILVEAMVPNSQTPVHQDWEPLLIGCGYRFVYADGLNRFYVAEEHRAVADAFAHPPNVFDQFARASEQTARQRMEHAEADFAVVRGAQNLARVEAESGFLHRENERQETVSVDLRIALCTLEKEQTPLRSSLERLGRRLAEAEEEGNCLRADMIRRQDEIDRLMQEGGRLRREVALRDSEITRLQSLYTSTSWRVTAPLRAIKLMAVRLVWLGQRAAFRPVRWLARLMRPLLLKLADWEWLRRVVIKLVGRDSTLLHHARSFLFGVPWAPCERMAEPSKQRPLTRDAREMLLIINERRGLKGAATDENGGNVTCE